MALQANHRRHALLNHLHQIEDIDGLQALLDALGLDDLADVIITAATTGDILEYNGSEWVNVPNTGGGGGYPPQLGHAGI